MKQASPSAGLLRPDYDPAARAAAYDRGGAAGLSVLTEPTHFRGSADDLRAARAASTLPILCKDFFCDPYQVLQAAAWGADVVLLIVAALDKRELRELYAAAREQNLEVLVESHSRAELGPALALEDAIVGVNSRNLKTLQTDLAVAAALAADIPPDRLSIAESGIRDREDIERLEALGYDGFLVGETLMRNADPERALAALRGAPRGTHDA
jgi:indole-3-glycerol phosphate synthase